MMDVIEYYRRGPTPEDPKPFIGVLREVPAQKFAQPVRESEGLSTTFCEIIDRMKEKPSEMTVVLVQGPPSSGKTTRIIELFAVMDFSEDLSVYKIPAEFLAASKHLTNTPFMGEYIKGKILTFKLILKIQIAILI